MQLVPIKVPLPYAFVSWKIDEQGRHFAPIPAFGELVRLSDSQEQTARKLIADTTSDPVHLAFEIEFADGTKALFMAKQQSPIVEGEFRGTAARSAT